ncbi:Aldo/keto reductase [Athelia psychrophila]|uniref:Aldo/keto reductase n=1 Tax=Athelia psychrophila TaxID=1759441 RepID=A0A166I8K0_9AGAM|nr:Aldo/keto reductase [Fibularhizoctonia sp. CBS 109695]
MSSTTIKLNDDTSVPWIAFGTGTALYRKDAAAQVKQAIDGGFTHLDGAQAYDNEESLGQGIKDSGKARSELYITTKLGKIPEGKTVKDTLEESLKKLGVDHVDLFLIHQPSFHTDPKVPGQEEWKELQGVWKQLEGVKKDGLTKSIGVSNFKIAHLEAIRKTATVTPAVNQIEFHPYVWGKELKELYTYSKQRGIVTASYSGLAPLTKEPEGPLKKILPGIRERVEKDYGKPVTEGQILLKWLKQKDILIVTTTSKQARIEEYLNTPKVPDLTEEEVKIIDEHGEKHPKRFFGSNW